MLSGRCAFHSPQMDPLCGELRDGLIGLQPRAGRIPFVSSVTGGLIAGTALGADYWPRNVRETVRFAEAFGTLRNSGIDVFLEIGPHPVLAASMVRLSSDAAPARDFGDVATRRGAARACSQRSGHCTAADSIRIGEPSPRTAITVDFRFIRFNANRTGSTPRHRFASRSNRFARNWITTRVVMKSNGVWPNPSRPTPRPVIGYSSATRSEPPKPWRSNLRPLAQRASLFRWTTYRQDRKTRRSAVVLTNRPRGNARGRRSPRVALNSRFGTPHTHRSRIRTFTSRRAV